MNDNIIKVAVAQAAPYFLERKGSVQKACDLINQAGKNGAKLIVFQNAFVSSYPDWVWVVPSGDWILANADPSMWQKMLDTIKSGKTGGYNLPWAQDAWVESYSPSRIAYSQELLGYSWRKS